MVERIDKRKINETLSIGTKVKIDLDSLDQTSLTADQVNYIYDNADKVYTIVGVAPADADNQLDDDFLSKTSFYDHELIKVTDECFTESVEYDEDSPSDQNMFDSFSTLIANQIGIDDDLTLEEEQWFNNAILNLIKVVKSLGKD